MTVGQQTTKEAAFEELCLSRFWFHTANKVEEYGDGTRWSQKPLWRYMHKEHSSADHLDVLWFDPDIVRGFEVERREDIEDQFADMAERIQQELQSRCDENGYAVTVRVEALDNRHVRNGAVKERRGNRTTFEPDVHYIKTSLRLTFYKPS